MWKYKQRADFKSPQSMFIESLSANELSTRGILFFVENESVQVMYVAQDCVPVVVPSDKDARLLRTVASIEGEWKKSPRMGRRGGKARESR